jgi:hypothetical protein
VDCWVRHEPGYLSRPALGLPRLYAAGEVAGFGGSMHGYRVVDGTFLGTVSSPAGQPVDPPRTRCVSPFLSRLAG